MNEVNACSDAERYLMRCVNVTRRFPLNVFVGAWSNYHFFDPDWIFKAGFVLTAVEFLRIENSNCGCLSDIDDTDGAPSSRFSFTRETVPADFQAVLAGQQLSDGWIARYSRFVCVSNLGQWAIYCERSNDLAVIAFATGTSVRPFQGVLDNLRALPTDIAVERGSIFGLQNALLPQPSRSILQREYGNHE